MTLEKLDNLVKIGQLKVEPPDQKEFDGMVAALPVDFVTTVALKEIVEVVGCRILMASIRSFTERGILIW